MKIATIPSLRVTPALREAAESVLTEGETLSGFVEDSLRRQIAHRRAQKEFIARGLAGAVEARAADQYLSKEQSLASLDAILRARQKS